MNLRNHVTMITVTMMISNIPTTISSAMTTGINATMITKKDMALSLLFS